MENKNTKKVLLTFGSEYGTAYDCCRNMFFELYTHFDIDFFSLDEINLMSFFKYENVIIIVSTTGYGFYTHNMSKFWQSLDNNIMFYENIYFHLFGLGDSSYENYNIIAKKLKKKLKSLDANIVNYNLGNYQHPSMHFTNFNIWKNNVYEFLRKKYFNFEINYDIPCLYKLKYIYIDGNVKNTEIKKAISQKMEEKGSDHNDYTNIRNINLKNINIDINNNMNTNKLNNNRAHTNNILYNSIQLKKETDLKHLDYEKEIINQHNISNEVKKYEYFNLDEHFCKTLKFMKFQVLKNERCTNKTYYQDVRYINLKSSYNFNVSSLIKVHPFLEEKRTKEILNLLKINYNDYIVIENNCVNHIRSTYIPFNKKIKVLDLFVYFLDLNKIVTPFFFYYLSKRTKSDMHKKKFLELADTVNISDYYSYVYQDKRSYYDIFYDFYSYINVDVDFLINTLPNIQERSYSILNTLTTYNFLKNFNIYNLYYYNIHPQFSSIIHFLKKIYLKSTLNIFSFYIEMYIYSRLIRNKINQNRYNIIELLVCLYEYEISKNKKLKGLCSDYLINLNPGSFIYSKIENSLIFINKNIFNLNYRIIYICTGVAISSLLSVIRHRHYLYKNQEKINKKKELSNNLEKDIIILGFRHKLQDFYFQEELANYLYFNYIYVAFSRDVENLFFYNNELLNNYDNNDHNLQLNENSKEEKFNINYEEMKKVLKKKKKIYVTDIILMLQNYIYDLIKKENTIILIAGKSRPFSQNLIKTFANIIKQKEPSKTIEEINIFLKKKIDNFSIILESWY
ncbi:DNA polymerase delta interacting protein, putative [Plasmodium gallinaceum]|uniref:DNA polymerase delta interacting protein, putative n=1 Tax=Plasmodium gallinaceum TaxID=5849 RepID=A0A1J1GQY0_PLAGA|nr:DNA polymerase delta interacting protein, putative [Plasmodium gallinaceum]CRG94698.1 DNA polymerase delta interacting protein, putative [Plasmodium gallinaceum]